MPRRVQYWNRLTHSGVPPLGNIAPTGMSHLHVYPSLFMCRASVAHCSRSITQCHLVEGKSKERREIINWLVNLQNQYGRRPVTVCVEVFRIQIITTICPITRMRRSNYCIFTLLKLYMIRWGGWMDNVGLRLRLHHHPSVGSGAVQRWG